MLVGLVAGVAWHWLGFVLPKLLQVQLFADFVEQLLRHFAELLKWQLPVGSVLVAVEAWDPGVQGRSARKLPLPAEATQVQMLLESPPQAMGQKSFNVAERHSESSCKKTSKIVRVHVDTALESLVCLMMPHA